MNINYKQVETLKSFYGVKLRGNETFKELLEIEKKRKKRKKKDNSKNGDVFTNCRDDTCKAPLYNNTSQSDTRYCMDCL